MAQFIPDNPSAASAAGAKFTPDAAAPVDPAEQREGGKYVERRRDSGLGLGAPPPTALDVMVNPKGTAQQLLSIPMSAAMFGVAGKGAQLGAKALNLGEKAQQVAPYIGRTLAGAGEWAAGAVDRGESLGRTGFAALKGGGATAVTEALLSALDRKGYIRGAAKAFAEGKELPMKALDLLRARLKTRPLYGGGVQAPSTISVPSMGSKRLTVHEAVEKLGNLEGPAYAQALQEIEQGMNALDKTKLVPQAGTAFRQLVAQTLKKPELGLRGALMSDTGRSIADAAATSPIYGMPALAVGGIYAKGNLSDYARRFAEGLIPH